MAMVWVGNAMGFSTSAVLFKHEEQGTLKSGCLTLWDDRENEVYMIYTYIVSRLDHRHLDACSCWLYDIYSELENGTLLFRGKYNAYINSWSGLVTRFYSCLITHFISKHRYHLKCLVGYYIVIIIILLTDSWSTKREGDIRDSVKNTGVLLLDSSCACAVIYFLKPYTIYTITWVFVHWYTNNTI